MNAAKALFSVLFSVLICSSVEVRAMDVPAPASPGAPVPSGAYTAGDLYILDHGEKQTIQLYSRALVVRPFASPDSNAEKFRSFLTDMGFTSENGVRVERLSALLGTQEAKTAVIRKEYVVVYFSKPVDVFKLIKVMSERSMIWEAHPVFVVDGEYVFPAGVWVRAKTITPDRHTFLHKRIQSFGYALPWEKRPPGIDKQMSYYMPAGPDFLNPLAMSRLIAEDLVVARAIPDFVSIQPLVKIARDASRVSGVMHDRFTFSYTISYNPKRVIVDTEKVKQWDVSMVRPEGVLEGLFKLDAVRTKNENGVATIVISVRLYQPGDFDLLLPPVFYSIIGAEKDTPPLEALLGRTGFKVVGLVPRNDKGEPKLVDIYDIKRMPMPAVGMSLAPGMEVFPKSDYRHWTGEFVTNNPALVHYGKLGGGLLAVCSALGLALIGGVYAGRAFVRRHRNAGTRFSKTYAEYRRILEKGSEDGAAKSLFIRQAHIELRRILGFGEGASRREMLPHLPDRLKPATDAALVAIDDAERTDPLTINFLREVRARLAGVRSAKRIDRIRTFLEHPLAIVRRKRGG